MNPSDIAAKVLQTSKDSLAPAERIEGGLTNESWLVRANDTAIVVRLGSRDTESLQIDRKSEASVLAAVAVAGIGPPVLMCEPDQGVLVTQHLPGSTWSSRDARSSRNVARIAELLRRLHALPVPEGIRQIDLQQIVNDYWNTLLSRGLASNTGNTATRTRARELIAELARDATRRLCHNDVHHLNIIDDGTLRLVDWEYAGAGDPYFDLASVCVYHEYSDDTRRELLLAYLGQDRPSAFSRLQRHCWVFNYIRELWFAVREMA